MIGIVKTDSFLAIELQPIYAKSCPSYLSIVVPIRCTNFGEYGIAFNKHGIHVYSKHTQYFGITDFIKDINFWHLKSKTNKYSRF